MMAICLATGVLVNFQRSANRQKQRVQRLLQMGNVQLFYDYQLTSSKEPAPPLPFKPSWLGRLVGRDYLHQVVEANLASPTAEQLDWLVALPDLEIVKITGQIEQNSLDQLPQLKRLRNLHLGFHPADSEQLCPVQFGGIPELPILSELTIQNTRLSDQHFRQLGQCPSLQTLRLLNVQIELLEDGHTPWTRLREFYWSASAAGKRSLDVEFLRYFTRLATFVFQSNEVIDSYYLPGSTNSMGISTLDDTVLLMLVEAKELEELSLFRTAVTGSGLPKLSSRKLRKLELPASQLNDQGLVHLSRFPELEFLEVGSTDISDDGMISLSHLNKLKTLSIRSTQISDLGLQKLQLAPNLRHLRIRNSNISASGIEAFEKNHPNCIVDPS
jgi:Leucine-rich repeat (LRR) protein